MLAEIHITYNLGLLGDTIEVSAYCNQGGSITESMTLGATSDSGEDSSTPGFELFTIIASIALTFILLKRKKVD